MEKGVQISEGENKLLCFGNIKLEMPIKHPNVDIKQAVTHMSLELWREVKDRTSIWELNCRWFLKQ